MLWVIEKTKEVDKYRTGFKRFIAAIVDGLLLLLPVIVFTANFGIKQEYAVLMSVFNMLLPVVYSVFMHFKYGQTLGKMLVNVQVKDISEEGRLTLKQALLRDSILIGLEIVGLISLLFLTYSDSPILQTLMDNIISNAVFLWTLLEIVSMLTNEKGRAIHDFIARTVVVKV
jgi:uncharacterized RDD family membrane protein YckC